MGLLEPSSLLPEKVSAPLTPALIAQWLSPASGICADIAPLEDPPKRLPCAKARKSASLEHLRKGSAKPAVRIPFLAEGSKVNRIHWAGLRL